jgi:D-alanyl-D-alanine carboxypeptidase
MLILFGVGKAYALDLTPPPTRPHIIIDTKTNAVVSEHQAFVRWAPASLTKMMTAYTVFKALDLQHLAFNSPVRISEYALEQPPSKMGFPIGTILTIEAALEIIMVKSANDIAVALAEATAGSEDQFVTLMNSHARRLGMSDTQFTNPHGLHSPEQFTSARDMAILSLAITDEYPQYDRFFNIPAVKVGGRRLRNHNALLRLFSGTTGLKTGYVCASGYNVAVRTKREGRELITVVLGGLSSLARNIRAAQLLEEAFANPIDPSWKTLAAFVDENDTTKLPEDITRETCPRKYAAQGKPENRPLDAPKSKDFDKIDTKGSVKKSDSTENSANSVAIPEVRPETASVLASTSASVSLAKEQPEPKLLPVDGDGSDILEDKPPTLRELAAIYFQPRTDLREDKLVLLGGGIGPNPFGLKHTDGKVYKAPIPVPKSRPTLDSEQAG